jgi:hypothetical protein
VVLLQLFTANLVLAVPGYPGLEFFNSALFLLLAGKKVMTRIGLKPRFATLLLGFCPGDTLMENELRQQ